MSNYGGPYSAFEKQFKEEFSAVSSRLTSLEDELFTVMNASIKNAEVTSAYWGKVRNDIDLIYNEMNNVYSKWSIKALERSYKLDLRRIRTRIEDSKYVVSTAEKGLYEMFNSRATTQTVGYLYGSANDDIAKALFTGRSNLIKFTRKTQQILLSQKTINLDVAFAFEKGNLKKAVSSLSNKFYVEMIDAIQNKRFVQAGKIKFRPRTYAELVSRTKWHEAHSYASLVQADNYGTDLMQVSSHNTTTEICMPYEGKIFSISGRDSRFPAMEQMAPYHPRCLHLEFPVFESSLIVQGTLQNFSDFSKGKTDRPPVPAGFTPIKERKAA